MSHSRIDAYIFDAFWPFNLGTPPLSLGRLMPRGSQKLSPRSNYYTTDLYFVYVNKLEQNHSSFWDYSVEGTSPVVLDRVGLEQRG